MEIRVANETDRGDVSAIHLSGFPASERDNISNLAVELLSVKSTPATLSLLADAEGTAIGHVALSPVNIGDGKNAQGYILAPLAVKPEHQKRGIGSQLVEDGIRRVSDMGVGIIFVYGDPTYYGKFGFTADVADRFTPPYDLQYPFGWQAITLDKTLSKDWSGQIACVPPLCNPNLW